MRNPEITLFQLGLMSTGAAMALTTHQRNEPLSSKDRLCLRSFEEFLQKILDTSKFLGARLLQQETELVIDLEVYRIVLSIVTQDSALKMKTRGEFIRKISEWWVATDNLSSTSSSSEGVSDEVVKEILVFLRALGEYCLAQLKSH